MAGRESTSGKGEVLRTTASPRTSGPISGIAQWLKYLENIRRDDFSGLQAILRTLPVPEVERSAPRHGAGGHDPHQVHAGVHAATRPAAGARRAGAGSDVRLSSEPGRCSSDRSRYLAKACGIALLMGALLGAWAWSALDEPADPRYCGRPNGSSFQATWVCFSGSPFSAMECLPGAVTRCSAAGFARRSSRGSSPPRSCLVAKRPLQARGKPELRAQFPIPARALVPGVPAL